MALTQADIARVKALGFLRNRGTELFSGRIVPTGTVFSAWELIATAEIAARFGNGKVIPTVRMTLELPGIPYERIDEAIEFAAARGLRFGGTGAKIRPVTSCKGTTCVFGMYDTQAMCRAIHEQYYLGWDKVSLPHKFKIAVGGCPNNCVKPDLNDLGIIGQLIPNFDGDECNGCKKCGVAEICPIGAAVLEDGELKLDAQACNNCGRCVDQCHFDAMDGGTFAYKIYIGGRWGKSVAVGKALGKLFATKEEALSVIEKALLLYREQGKTGERFATTIERLGFEHVERELLSDEILERKQTILDAQLHLVGGATC